MGAWTGSYLSIDGQILDGVEVDGVSWGIDEVDGWGSTDPTLQLTQKARGSGAWGGDSEAGPRSVSIKGWCTVPTDDMLSLAGDRLIAAVKRTAVPLVVVEAGRARTAQVQRSDIVDFKPRRRRYATWSVQVQSKDWRKFAAPLIGQTHLPASAGGLTIPFTVPFTIASTLVAGQVNLVNDGNETGPVVLRVDGPTTGPVITHVSSGLAIVFSSSLVLGAGEWLDIDMEKHTALANGQSSRSGYITSRGWSGFDPGPNTWAFSAAVYDAASLLTVTATPAFE